MDNQSEHIERSLASRLVRTVLTFYLIVAGSITIFQLGFEFRSEKSRLVQEVHHVADTFSPIVMQALWNLDQEQIEISLRAMLGTNSDIHLVELLDNKGVVEFDINRSSQSSSSSREVFFEGLLPKDSAITEKYSFSFPLVYNDEYSGTQHLGKLVLTTDNYVIIRRVAPIFYITLLSALVKTMTLSFIFVIVLNRMVGKPMKVLAKAMNMLDPKNVGSAQKELTLDPKLLGAGDEIASTLNSFQSMKEAIEYKDRALSEYQSHLEEKILERTQQVEKVFKEKSDFLANMSHEIRTPLNGVLGITKLLSGTNLDPGQRRYLEIIDNSGSTLLKTINAILDHLKIEAGKITLEKKLFSIEDIVENSTGLFVYQARTSNINLSTVVDRGCPRWVLGDPTRLQQILTNLLSNAFKFTTEGFITLEVSKIQEYRSGQVVIRFLVKDSGIGVKQGKIQGLFLPFSQADSSTTRKYGGTGLGLSISKQLTELMNGTINASSSLGEGAHFWIDVPFQLECAPAGYSKRHQELKSKLAGKRILLAGISPVLNAQLSEEANFFAMEPIYADDGQRGLALYNEAIELGQRFDLVVVNDALPDLEGFVFVEDILELSGKKSLPAFVLLDFKEQINYSKPLGKHFQYLSTPISNKEFVNSMAMAIAGGSTNGIPEGEKVVKSYGHVNALIAEDNPVNQMVIAGVLKKLGVQTRVVANGQEAIDFFACNQNHSINLILMDCEMPVMDGWEATRKLREFGVKLQSGKAVPIYALSAHTKDKFIEQAESVGMDGYMFKPVIIEQLIEILEKID